VTGYKKFVFLSVTVMIFCYLTSVFNSEAAESRGLRIVLKANEAPDAPIAGEVSLYKSSHALVIGIDDYSEGWPRLSNAIKDAEIVADALQRKGFSVSIQKNQAADDLEKALEEFFIFKGDSKGARLFVWFANHGHTDQGEGYLVPADAPLPQNGAEFRHKALSMRRFGEYVRQARAKHVFAVFDACFSGTIFTSRRSLPPVSVTRATTFPVRQFLASGDANQTVSDDGLFRKLFIRAIHNEELADANNDGYLLPIFPANLAPE